MKLTSLQFELWEDCNTLCKFCYLGKNRNTDANVKIESLKATYEKICDNSIYEHYNVLSYIGGEFFQGQLSNPTVRELFFKVMQKTAELSDSGVLEQVWITASLTIGDQKDLYDTIDLFKDKSKVWICTSYDTIGRYQTDKMFETWDYHMKNLKKKYPNIQLNSSIILTGDLVQKYLNNKFSFTEYSNIYQSALFLKTPGIMSSQETTIENKAKFNNDTGLYFFPKRQDFLNFLTKFKYQETEYMYDKLYNIKYRADDLYKKTQANKELNSLSHRVKEQYINMFEDVFDKEGDRIEIPVSKCGHLIRYQPYVDSNACFICDKMMIEEL